MATMQLVDIREMGEGLTRARELCQGAQYEQGLALYETTLNRLRQFIRKMNKMSERQPWLQMQIELENELNLLTDHVEMIQAFKVPPGAQRRQRGGGGGGLHGHEHHVAGAPPAVASIKNHNYRAPGPVDDPSPGWEVYTPESRKQREEDHDPDVWAPPSPDQFGRGGRNGVGGGRVNDGGGGFGAARAPPSWANNDMNNRGGGNNNRAAKLAPKSGAANRQAAQPSGRRTPSDDQRKAARPGAKGNSNGPVGKSGGNANAKGGDKGAPGPAKQLGPGGKQKYADLAKEEGWVDLELIEMIERDIVDNGAKVTFENIAGLEHTKQLLQEAVMLPQIAPHLFKDGRLKPCSGVLMFGPPGTGKTLLAKAVANVCNTTFFNVSASTLASKYRGESEKMVRILFDMARYYSPSIIFMDEIDAIAGARGGSQEHESSRRVKTELLVQMNGVSSGDPGDPSNRVMVLAATNLPWELDEAMRRRLTKRVYIPLPGPEGRHQLFKINLEKVDLGPDIDYDMLVAETEGYSGDDICGVCETAKMMPVKRLYTPEVLKELHRKKQEGASEEELKAHEKNALVVTWTDFKTALENVSKSVGADQLERFVKWEVEFGSK